MMFKIKQCVATAVSSDQRFRFQGRVMKGNHVWEVKVVQCEEVRVTTCCCCLGGRLSLARGGVEGRVLGLFDGGGLVGDQDVQGEVGEGDLGVGQDMHQLVLIRL